MSKAVVCIAESSEQAKAILYGLMSAGFSRNDISVIHVFDFVPEKAVATDKARRQRQKAIARTRHTRGSQKILGHLGNGKR